MLASIALAEAAACSAPARARPFVTWGKPGVSFGDYRRDAVDCGTKGATTSMTGQEDYAGAMLGLARQDADMDLQHGVPAVSEHEDPTLHEARAYALNAARSGLPRRAARLQGFLQAQTTHCLIDRGYRRFALTRAQSHALAKLAHGSPARFAFLHRLAQDPAVLTAQAIAPPQ